MSSDSEMFTWLHLSDLHAGLTPQGWLWPGVKNALFEDLERLHRKLGQWDAVIFSGDLTQAGTPDEFEKLQAILSEIWARFADWGWNPPLIVVPGNHDLVRPSETNPASILLRRWWEESAVQDAFWQADSPYYSTVEHAFANYSSWMDSLGSSSIATCPSKAGIIPGDRAFELDVRGRTVGVLALNSSWLQLGGGDYSGKLHLDSRQIMALTDEDPDAWCRSHHVNLIVSHHPATWLHPSSKKDWDSEINPPGRFDAHLFGHMHEPDSLTTAQSGSEPRTALQAASLFGLEKLPDGSSERIHGFNIGRISLDGATRRRQIWPRRLVRQNSGKRRLVPDYAFDLHEDNSFVEEYPSSASPGQLPSTPQTATPATQRQIAPATIEGRAVLDKVRYHLPASKAQINVRTFEQQASAAALQQVRAVWHHADWGMGSDGFLWAVQHRLGHSALPTFKLDLQRLETRGKFFDTIKDTLGVSFEQLCELISREDEAYLVLDDVPVGHMGSGNVPIEQDVENLVRIILEYCPKVLVVIRSRQIPNHIKLPSVSLMALDEADLGTYLTESELGGSSFARPDVIARLFRHTDGAPSRVDTALEELKVVALSGLVSANPDFAGTTGDLTDIPAALIHAVGTLVKAADPHLRRAYELLKTLSIFPQGEQLERVKRFNNAFPFFPAHARELLNRSLITTVTATDVGAAAGSGDVAKILVVPKPVRDYLKTVLKPAELKSLDRKAFELYFGERWKSGVISSSSRFDAPLQSVYRISNASALVVRLLRGANDGTGSEDSATALRFAISYVSLIFRGDHYRSVVSLCDDLLDIVSPDEWPSEYTMISYQRARSLRMIGDAREARDALNKLDLNHLPKPSRQSALLNLALAHQTLGEDEDAVRRAEETISLGRAEDAGIQAKAIVIELDAGDASRWVKLEELETKCRRRKSITLANNIALRRAAATGLSAEERDAIFRAVFVSSFREKDFYNETRAIVEVSRRRLAQGEELTDLERTRLIGSYHFLFNERLTALFENCHDVLWSEFEFRHDTENLLRLFRHSSLIWRLRGKMKREEEYLKKLAVRVGDPAKRSHGELTREIAYYLARASAALLEASSKLSELAGPDHTE